MAETLTLARPYAKAIFEVSKNNSSLPERSEQLKNLASVVQSDEVSRILNHPAVSDGQKKDLLLELCGIDADSRLDAFLGMLSDNKRLSLLPEIEQLFESHKSELESSVNVEVETAFELNDEQKQTLANALQSKLGRKVSIQSRINESLLGGVLVRAGDLVIDSSVRGRLQKLMEAMNP